MGAQLLGIQKGTREGTRRLRMGRPGTRTRIVRACHRTGWTLILPQRSDEVGWTERQNENVGCGRERRLARVVCCGGPYLDGVRLG